MESSHFGQPPSLIACRSKVLGWARRYKPCFERPLHVRLRQIRAQSLIPKSEALASFVMNITHAHLDALPALGYSEAGAFTAVIPFSPVVGFCFALCKGDGRSNKARHPLRHRSRHPMETRSCWEDKSCAWRDYQFGRGQNTALGSSDPTSAHHSVAKVMPGSLLSARPTIQA